MMPVTQHILLFYASVSRHDTSRKKTDGGNHNTRDNMGMGGHGNPIYDYFISDVNESVCVCVCVCVWALYVS